MRLLSLKTLPNLLALLLALAAPAQACISTPEERRAEFDRRDADGDGYLSLQEYYGDSAATKDIPQDVKEKTFEGFDADGDGKMNFEEYSAQRQKMRC